MVDKEKKSLGDILKKALEPKKEEVKKTPAGRIEKSRLSSIPKTPAAKPSTAKSDLSSIPRTPAKSTNLEAELKKQEEVLHTKTHQDLINAGYKAAEKLGIAPYVLLRAAKWGNFTDDRGKKYDGPAIDAIDTLEDDQKKALKEVLGL